MAKKDLVAATLCGTDAERLKALLEGIANTIVECESPTAYAALARQYRETMDELSALVGDGSGDAEIDRMRKRHAV